MYPAISDAVLFLAVATLGGAAVGVERQRSGHASGPDARFAGVRTFTLLGALSGLAGLLWTWNAPALAVTLLASAGAMVVAAYVSASRRSIDGTTEVAALVVLAAGTAAGLGRPAVASGVVALTVLLLFEKSRLHGLVGRLDEVGLAAAARFAVMAAVVLPLLPEGPYGPLGGVRPRELWVAVLFFSGLSFGGYVARRLVGASRGYALAGLMGGMVSSTHVTLTFSRLSRDHPGLALPLAQGAVAASTVLFGRVLVAAAVLHPPLAVALAPWFVAPAMVGAATVARGLWRGTEGRLSLEAPRNPLQLGASIQMAALFQAVLFAMALSSRWLGEGGILSTGAVLGLTDVDALTLAMAKGATTGQFAAEVAARAVAVGILANTAVKTALVVALGRGRYRLVSGAALGLMGAALGAALVWR